MSNQAWPLARRRRRLVVLAHARPAPALPQSVGLLLQSNRHIRDLGFGGQVHLIARCLRLVVVLHGASLPYTRNAVCTGASTQNITPSRKTCGMQKVEGNVEVHTVKLQLHGVHMIRQLLSEHLAIEDARGVACS